MNDWIEMGMLLLIPAVMIVIGAVFLKRPPKRVNGFYGYRTARSMSSQEAWDFAHRACGRLWLGCGIAAGLICLGVAAALQGDRALLSEWSGTILLLQCLLMMGTILPVEGALKRNFDQNGHRIDSREDKKQ